MSYKKFSIAILLVVGLVLISVLFIKQNNVSNTHQTFSSTLEDESMPDSGLTLDTPSIWKKLDPTNNNVRGTEEDYNSSYFVGIKPKYDEIIPYTTSYPFELPYCPDNDSECLSNARIDLIEYSDSQSYLMGCRGDCEVFDLRSEESLLKAEAPTFTSKGLDWFCNYAPNGGGWTLTFSCQTHFDKKNINAELSYSSGLRYLGVEEKAIDGTLTFKEFSDLVKLQDSYQQAEKDFLEFVKTITINN